MRRLFLIAVILLFAAGGWIAFGRKSQPGAAASRDIPDRYLARVEKRDIESAVELTGDVMPLSQLDVKAEVGGKLKALHVQPGQEVRPGDLLVEIDDTDLLTEKATATTEIAGSKLVAEKRLLNFKRGKELFAAKLINQEAFDNLQADYKIDLNTLEKSQRRLDTVEDRLRKTKILAPSDGTVLSVPITLGQVVVAAASVNSGTTIMSIADLSKLIVTTNVNQIDVTKLGLGQKVHLQTDAIKDMTVEAEINFIAPVATSKNNVKGFEVKALIASPDPRLRPGMTVNISVPVASAKAVISVPIAAVFRGDKNTRIVYLRTDAGSEPREVKVGLTNFEYAEIQSGVEAGDEILLVEPRVLAQSKA